MSTQTVDPPQLSTLTIEIDGDLGTLTLNRPDAFNAMSPEMIEELMTATAWLADRAPIRALIVTGAGPAFCAGGDVTWFRRGIEEEGLDISAEVRRGAEALHTAIVELRRIEVPVIAAVNGPAMFHAEIPAMSDIVLAADHAYFQDVVHFPSGIVPGDGSHIVWTHILGANRGRAFLLTGQQLDAETAKDYGLVHEVVPRERLMERAFEFARDIAAKSYLTRKYTRAVLTHNFRKVMAEGLGYGLALEGLGCLASFSLQRENAK
jgi:enoyl-CoA hydratase/carnithine racemase